MRPGASASVRCDGCEGPIDVRIDFVAPQAEFTPPVIYSRENRTKLVFLVEARPSSATDRLKPGLPVEVTLSATPSR